MYIYNTKKHILVILYKTENIEIYSHHYIYNIHIFFYISFAQNQRKHTAWEKIVIMQMFRGSWMKIYKTGKFKFYFNSSCFLLFLSFKLPFIKYYSSYFLIFIHNQFQWFHSFYFIFRLRQRKMMKKTENSFVKFIKFPLIFCIFFLLFLFCFCSIFNTFPLLLLLFLSYLGHFIFI